jgi:hypothetical protein
MRAIHAIGRSARHGALAGAEAIVIAALVALLLIALAPMYAPANFLSGTESVGAADNNKFALSVRGAGTSSSPVEVLYEATNQKGGLGGGAFYAVRHVCYSGGEIVTDQTKGLWFPSSGSTKTGNAYFFAFGDRCSAVVIDLYADAGGGGKQAARAGATALSNTLEYSTSSVR